MSVSQLEYGVGRVEGVVWVRWKRSPLLPLELALVRRVGHIQPNRGGKVEKDGNGRR